MATLQTTHSLARHCAPVKALCWVLLVWVIFATPALIPALHAEKPEKSGKNDKPSRKLVYRVEPEYPWDLKRAGIGGIVRLDVTISTRGVVDTVTPIGGNPILVEAASRAVKRWRYAPSDSETEILINVEFDPHYH